MYVVVNHLSGVDRNQTPKPTLQHLTRPNTTSAGRRPAKKKKATARFRAKTRKLVATGCSLDEPAALPIWGTLIVMVEARHGTQGGTGVYHIAYGTYHITRVGIFYVSCPT